MLKGYECEREDMVKSGYRDENFLLDFTESFNSFTARMSLVLMTWHRLVDIKVLKYTNVGQKNDDVVSRKLF
jgi:hypothetical protein